MEIKTSNGHFSPVRQLYAAACVDPTSLGKSGHPYLVLADEKKIKERFETLKKKFNDQMMRLAIPPQNEWQKLPQSDLSNLLDLDNVFQQKHVTARLKEVSPIRIVPELENQTVAGSMTINHRDSNFLTCTLLLEDKNGQTIQTLPVVGNDLVKSMTALGSPRREIGFLATVLPMNGYFTLLVLDA